MKRVLVINDCKFESAILRDMLIELGYDVKVTSEFLAFNDTKKYIPDLVICNLFMKKITGDKLIKKIKDIDENILNILSSSSKLRVDDYKNCGVDEVIKTPITIEELRETLNKLENKNNRSMFLFCPYCGEQLENGSFLFCPYCGKKLK
ncbi:response regulator [Clostridium lundense]|uniref:response regulator n=1 Tax=Clostridium lundense TaxID=319475 RepID=UPI0004870C86|nr:response regulator [Clostridium lundense]